MTVIEFPKPPRKRLVRAVEMYAQREPPDEMVWELCPYLRRDADACEGCAETFIDPDYGECSPGCYVFAKEACRVIFAMQARENSAEIVRFPVLGEVR